MLLMFCSENKGNKKVGIPKRKPTLICVCIKKFYRTAIIVFPQTINEMIYDIVKIL